MSLIVKICGLSTRETLDAALDAGADMVGFVFFPPSPRHLGLEKARELGKQAKGRAVKVALSVDADDATLANIVDALQPDILQLHGKETRGAGARHQAEIRFAGDEGDCGRNVGRSRGAAGLCRGRRPHPVRCPRAETCHPPRRPRRGLRLACVGRISTSKCRSWFRAASNAANVAEAVRVTRAGGVDVSSGVESAPGIKDPDMIRAFRPRAARAHSKRLIEPDGIQTCPIPSAAVPTRPGISAFSAAALSPKR